MAVIDLFTYNGERDMLKLHLNVLNPYVDKFIVCESKKTFTGKDKPLYFFRDQRFFQKFWKKIDYFVIPDTFTPYELEIAEQSPNTKGAPHWKTEFLQKETIKYALIASRVQDNDLVFIGDVDEIWDANPEGEEILYPAKLKLNVYSYYLNNKSNEQFWGTYVNFYRNFKHKVINHERTRTDIRTEKEHGWHFTNVMPLEEIRRKLNDSYTEQSYNTPDVQELLERRHKTNTDYLGRNFTFTKNESNWPQYLKNHKREYQHLMSIDTQPELVAQS